MQYPILSFFWFCTCIYAHFPHCSSENRMLREEYLIPVLSFHFVKQMILDNGTRQPDPMNSTFYFVKEEGFNGPAWKLIYMNALVKEADN